MRLTSPCEITPRLLCGVRCGGAFISIDYANRPGRENRQRYLWHIDLPDGQEFSGDDLQSGNSGEQGLRAGLESLLSFLAACGESVNYGDSTGRRGENADLFPSPVAAWCAEHIDELSALAMELTENTDCVQEDY